MIYNRNNWYWVVGDNAAEVYSSAVSAYTPIADETYAAWLAAGGIPTRISADDMLKIQIDILEDFITPRRVREAVLGTDAGWLIGVNSAIAALRAQLI